MFSLFFFSSRRRHTRCALVTGVQTCALPICLIVPRGGEMEQIERHTMAVLVQNEPGVLARVIGLFSGRGYNIESLTVAPVTVDESMSRITIVTTGTPMIIEQIRNQLDQIGRAHV